MSVSSLTSRVSERLILKLMIKGQVACTRRLLAQLGRVLKSDHRIGKATPTSCTSIAPETNHGPQPDSLEIASETSWADMAAAWTGQSSIFHSEQSAPCDGAGYPMVTGSTLDRCDRSQVSMVKLTTGRSPSLPSLNTSVQRRNGRSRSYCHDSQPSWRESSKPSSANRCRQKQL